MKCAAHPNIETNLKCGKCGKPICPKCLVQSPVGARCPECARVNKLPTFRVSGSYYLRAIGAALATAVVIGVVWGIAWSYLGFLAPFIGLVVFYATGYFISNMTGRAVNLKRGPWLALIGGLAVPVCWGISYLTWGWFMVHIHGFDFPSLNTVNIVFTVIGVGYGIYVSVNRLR